MSAGVHMVAFGARTPVGSTAESSAAAVRAGISRIVLHPFMADRENENVCGALDSSFDPGIIGSERLAWLACAALRDLLSKLLPALKEQTRITVLVAFPEPRPGIDETVVQQVLDALRQSTQGSGHWFDVRAHGRGHAGGLQALCEASQTIREGRDSLCIAGGVDSYFDFDTIDWLQDGLQLNNAESRGGFAPGEGAGFVALASERTQAKLRLASLGTVKAWGIAQETKLIKSDAINLGEGLAQAVQKAVSGLQLPADAADAVYCDINGERYRSEEWGLALLKTPQAVRGDCFAPVDSWGDVGAASGPLLCNLAAQAWARAYAKGPRALIWTSSEGGMRVAALLEAPKTESSRA